MPHSLPVTRAALHDAGLPGFHSTLRAMPHKGILTPCARQEKSAGMGSADFHTSHLPESESAV